MTLQKVLARHQKTSEDDHYKTNEVMTLDGWFLCVFSQNAESEVEEDLMSKNQFYNDPDIWGWYADSASRWFILQMHLVFSFKIHLKYLKTMKLPNKLKIFSSLVHFFRTWQLSVPPSMFPAHISWSLTLLFK